MKICIAQIKPIKGDISANINLHKKWIEHGVSQQADLICFPELSLTGYEPSLAKELATDQNDSRLDDFQKISDQYKIAICVGLPVKSSSKIFISMIIFQPNQARKTYTKQILHQDETLYFSKGCEQLIFIIKNKKIAPAICYESLQDEHVENAKKLGAEIYLASVAKSQNGIEKAFKYFPTIAKKYSMPVLMSNCIGYCDDFNGVGQSAVWDDDGLLKGKLSEDKEGILVYDADTGRISQKEETPSSSNKVHT